MIRLVVSTAFLVFSSTIANAQEYYYWANGMKYPLELYSERQYILMRDQNKITAAQGLEISEQNISELKPIIISKTINSNRAGKPLISNLYWAFVNSSINKAKVMSSDIIYAAPSFLANGKEIGLSQYFYVKLKQEKDIEILESLAKKNLVEIIGFDRFMPLWYVLSCDKNSKGNALEMANLFYELGYFDSAEPDLMVDFSLGCTNDPLFANQWHLDNTGQAGGTAGNDIRACQAWNITTGCANVIVAVLDHGLEFLHPDFNNISPISFDTETGTTPSVIRGSHGVAVAGVIGANRNNSLGVSGVSPNAQLMSISNDLVLAPLLSQRLANGINFAWQNGAAIINNSWGSNSIEQQGLINDAINNAVTQGRGGLGTIVICISHNQGANSIAFPSNNPQTIAVGAINRTASRASFSNFGTGLDVVAPGVEISTTDRQGTAGFNTGVSPGGDFTTLDGTSFAAPQVSGIAALILSINPNLTLQQVRNIIQSTTDKVGGVTYTLNAGEQVGLTWNNQMGYGRVNALSALQASLPTITGNILCTNLNYTLSFIPPNSTVTWTANNPTGLNINANTGLATRLNNYDGPATVTALINGFCGSYSIAKLVWVGRPVSSVSGSGYAYPGQLYTYNAISPNINGAINYNWVVVGGTIYGGGGSSDTSVTIFWNESGYIELTSENLCGVSTGRLDVTVDLGGGCNPCQIMQTYPNPSSDELKVSLNKDLITDKDSGKIISSHVILIDNMLDIAYSTTIDKHEVTIPTTNLRQGMYVLKVVNARGEETRQILIKR